MFKNRIFSGLYFARFSLNIENYSENFEYGHLYERQNNFQVVIKKQHDW